MIAFFRAYPEPSDFSPPAVAKLSAAAKVPQPVAKLPAVPTGQPPVEQFSNSLLWVVPWAHHVIIMEKIKDPTVRRWYMERTLTSGWSRNILALQIDAQAHVRHGKTVSNFSATLRELDIGCLASCLIRQGARRQNSIDFLLEVQ